MQAESGDLTVPKSPPVDLGIPEDLKTSPINTEALEEFAQMMSENIIQSFISQKETAKPEEASSNQEQEMLAEELASAVIEVALSEVCRGRNLEDHMEVAESSRSAGVKIDKSHFVMDKSGKDKDFLNTEMDPVKELQTSNQPYHPPLSQSGLPAVGSLDYPDAPPTTPLLPELERSRHSFARKLKGGLAKVFLPSPPPPTPKEKEDSSDSSVSDAHVELMEHLMHSLSTNDLGSESFEVAPLHEPTMEAFAEALSCDITNWVLAAQNHDLHLLAHELAETIIISSIDEAKCLSRI